MSVFEIDTRQSENQIAHLKEVLGLIPGGIQLACTRAANKSIKSLKVVAKAAIREDYNIKSGDLDRQFYIRQASKYDPFAVLEASGSRSISLSHFDPRDRTVVSNRATSSGPVKVKHKGVTVKVKKAGGRKLVQGGFRMPSGTIMKRVGTDRLPIAKLWGPSPLRMLADASVLHELEFQAEELMAKNLEHEATHILRQAGLR
ncbi:MULTISPECIES: phage tail protein [unclassified Maridesulfovibrio]|uniref:phage tail protein n=1 Tax=unclassified Maridesulfovibrio TaxID=2794999 RepID=UPI003B3D2007